MRHLLAAYALIAAPMMAQAACTGELPAQNPLQVYTDSASDRVIGGIGANQCGLEVSNFCANDRCLMFFDGLSGYVDVTALQSGSISPALTHFEYNVTEIDGELSFMGQSQSFQMADDAVLRIEVAADHVLLSLPAPLVSDIAMVSTGSSGWEAKLPDWVGVPVPVGLYLDRLSAPRATLELVADHQLLKMNMRLTLMRLSENLATLPTPTTVVDPSETACEETHARALRVGDAADQTQIDAFYAAVASAGITDWDNRSKDQCVALLAALATSASTPSQAPKSTSDYCGPLAAELRPILRGTASADKKNALRAMVALGVTSIGAATQEQCAALAKTLER